MSNKQNPQKKERRSTTSEIITQNLSKTQGVLTNTLQGIPTILSDGETRVYFLVRDLHEDMEKFIFTGKAEAPELSVFPEIYEQELIKEWKSRGFRSTYRTQPLDYMSVRVIIKYLEVSNPCTGVSISLMPWFMLPGRPYPVFTYFYALWHYANSQQKSMRLSAMVTEEIFGIKGFSKSTISRSMKIMEQFISAYQMDCPLPTKNPEIPSVTETTIYISELLENCTSVESLRQALWTRTTNLPPPIRRGNNISYALSLIPNELSLVLKEKATAIKKNHDDRNREARPRAKRMRSVQRRLDFIESHKISRIRQEFITLCKACVMNAAVSYHRFLI